MTKLACLFPGQGSQFVGMGRDFFEQSPEARKRFEEIDELARRPISKLCFEGPDSELKRTVNTQATILAVSLVVWELYKQAGGPAPAMVAGHSLGEFPALYASGALSLSSVVALVEKRAKLMESCPPGAMAAVIGLKADPLKELCNEISARSVDKVVIVANFNTKEQLVISGDVLAVEQASAAAKALGAKVIVLPVGGAFHSPLMHSVADQFKQLIDQCQFNATHFPVVQNYNAQPAQEANCLKQALSMQMPNSVRWCETIEYMLAQGITHFVEIGPGKALSGMVKRIDRSALTFNIEDSQSLAKTISALEKAIAE